jgi:hypothetical protein
MMHVEKNIKNYSYLIKFTHLLNKKYKHNYKSIFVTA